MENIEYKNMTIKIFHDSDPMNIREEWDNLATMYFFHKRYSLGDKHNLDMDEVNKIFHSKKYISLPVYMYDHSGITINTTGFSCSFDSGQIGIISVSKEKVKKQFNWKKITKKREKLILSYLESEVTIYDNYLTGDVFYYTIENEDNEEIDSCSGFYGADHEKSGLLEQAKSIIDNHLKNKVVQLDLFKNIAI